MMMILCFKKSGDIQKTPSQVPSVPFLLVSCHILIHVITILFFHREKRITEMKAQAARMMYGEIQPITKEEWTKEVTEASHSCWVIAYLWDTAVDECKLMDALLRVVAKNHRDVKFVSIQSKACIENWPQVNLPTLFMYHNGQLENQVLSIRKLGGHEMKVEGEFMHPVSRSVTLGFCENDFMCCPLLFFVDLEEHLASCGVFKQHD
jgi:hypothetical protein